MTPNQPVYFFEFFDFIIIGLCSAMIGALLYAHYKRTGSLLGTISETVAATKSSSIIFSVVMSVLFPLYYAFIWLWVNPKAHMPAATYTLLVVSGICEWIFVWVPARQGTQKKIHLIAASIVFICMIVLPLMFMHFGKPLSPAAKIAIPIYIATSIILAIFLIIQRFRRYTLIYEIIYCAAFWTVISILAHTS